MHGSIHLFVALLINMVQEGLPKRLILLGGQYPDHVLHSFAGPAPPLPFHAIAVEPVIRFCSTQVDFCAILRIEKQKLSCETLCPYPQKVSHESLYFRAM